MCIDDFLLDLSKIPILLFIFLLIGKLLYGNLNIKIVIPISKPILEIILGFIVFISIFAIIVSVGKTILLLFLILLFLQYLSLNIRPNLKLLYQLNKNDIFSVLLLFSFYLFYVGVQLYRHDYFNSEYLYLGWGDYGFYSDLAEQLNISGIERSDNWHQYFTTSKIAFSSFPSPYHYFEIWTQATMLRISKTNGIFVFIYILTPLLLTFVSGSFIILLNAITLKLSKLRLFILIISILFFPFFIGKIPFLYGGWADNVLISPRNFLFYILFILFIVFNKTEYNSASLFFLGLIGYINILYLPIISVLLMFTFLIQFLHFRNTKKGLYAFFIAFFLSISSFIFYFIIFKSEGAFKFEFNQLNPFIEYLEKGLHYFFRLQLARIWFFYFPLTLCIFYFIFNSIKMKQINVWRLEIIFVSTTILLVSLFFASFVPHLEHGTFAGIVLNPLLSVLSFLGVVFLIQNLNLKLVKVNLFLFYVQLFYSFFYSLLNLQSTEFIGNKYSKAFLSDLSTLSIKNKIGIFIADKTAFYKSPFACKSNLSWHTSIFDVLGNGFSQVSLSAIIYSDSIPYQEVKYQVAQLPIYKFANFELSRNTQIKRENIELNFIDEYNIEYCIVEKYGIIPPYLKTNIKSILEDEYSGIKVCLIEKTNQ